MWIKSSPNTSVELNNCCSKAKYYVSRYTHGQNLSDALKVSNIGLQSEPFPSGSAVSISPSLLSMKQCFDVVVTRVLNLVGRGVPGSEDSWKEV